jgi:Flp pilus assembly protein TadD
MSELKGGFPDSYSRALALPLLAIATTAIASSAPANGQAAAATAAQRVQSAERELEANVRDPKKRFELAEALRLSGNLKKAAVEYLDVTSLEPAYYIAYHELIRSKPTEDQLEEALERLKKLEEKRPKNLMLRVALSEVFEKKGDLYNAARALVDLQYTNGIPEKYQTRINTRIHYLLSKSKDVASLKTARQSQEPSEDIDAVPLPLPESGLDNGVSATKLKDAKVPEGYGHARLLP